MIANLHNADIPQPVLDVIARLRDLGHAVYLVGAASGTWCAWSTPRTST